MARARRRCGIILSAWPSPIIFCGREVGQALAFPGAALDKSFGWAPAHPAADAYRAFAPMPYDAPMDDVAALRLCGEPRRGLVRPVRGRQPRGRRGWIAEVHSWRGDGASPSRRSREARRGDRGTDDNGDVGAPAAARPARRLTSSCPSCPSWWNPSGPMKQLVCLQMFLRVLRALRGAVVVASVLAIAATLSAHHNFTAEIRSASAAFVEGRDLQARLDEPARVNVRRRAGSIRQAGDLDAGERKPARPRAEAAGRATVTKSATKWRSAALSRRSERTADRRSSSARSHRSVRRSRRGRLSPAVDPGARGRAQAVLNELPVGASGRSLPAVVGPAAWAARRAPYTGDKPLTDPPSSMRFVIIRWQSAEPVQRALRVTSGIEDTSVLPSTHKPLQPDPSHDWIAVAGLTAMAGRTCPSHSRNTLP